MGVGTKERAKAFVDISSFEDARKILVGDADAGVGLPIFQKNVIAGIIFLDETILKKESVFFCIDNGLTDVSNLGNQYFGLESIYFFVEIRWNTLF